MNAPDDVLSRDCNPQLTLTLGSGDDNEELFARFSVDKSGAIAIEYGLIAAPVAVVIITAVTTMGDNLATTFDVIATVLAAT